MPGRFDEATDPTERALSQLKDAIRGEAGKPAGSENSPNQGSKGKTTRKVETVLVVTAVSVMIGVFILLVIWLR